MWTKGDVLRVDGLACGGRTGGDFAPAYRPGVDVAKLVAMFGVVATHVVGYGLRPAPDAAHPAAIRLRARLFALLRLDALCDGLCARVAARVKGRAAP